MGPIEKKTRDEAKRKDEVNARYQEACKALMAIENPYERFNAGIAFFDSWRLELENPPVVVL